MADDFTAFHDELRAVARDLLARSGPGGEPAWDLLAESGWLGLEVPEALDGSGATFVEVAVIAEELGRAAAVAPFLGSVVLGVGALDLAAPSPLRDELLAAIASGEHVVATVVGGDADDLGAGAPPFEVESSSGEPRLWGRADFVPDASVADRLLVPAVDADGTPVLVLVDAAASGVTITERPLLDATRRLGLVVADGAAVGEGSRLALHSDASAAAPLRSLHDRAAVALAADSLGLAAAMLDATVAYAGVRQQFGRPIGSFQAVKHQCADALVSVTLARELVGSAATALADPLAATEPDAIVAVSMAASYATSVAVDVVGTALQLHGGIGYTWESGIHTYLTRATLNRSLFGSPAAHRARLAERYP